jgi:uncharacterized membrane protein
MIYVAGSVVFGLGVPRVEQVYLASYTLNLSVASAQAYLSAAASGMMTLTGIVFAMAFVMVQFSAIAYSPRLVLWFARDRALFHALGVFSATFIYALFTLAWVDRAASGSVPLLSSMLVGVMLIFSMLVGVMLIFSMLLFARLVQRLTDLQVASVLHLIGDQGRRVIGEMFPPADGVPIVEPGGKRAVEGFRAPDQVLKYSGEPRTIAKFNIASLVRQAHRAKGVIMMTCAVGDTLVKDTVLLQVHGAGAPLVEKELMQAIHLERERTFEQDPKYPIRLLVDVAIKALSPAINDPTTAVQTIDQIEDLLRRLGGCELDAGYAKDADGALRLVFPMPTWEDYLMLAFDEIRQYGAGSVQVMRRLRSALAGLMESVSNADRAKAVRRYLEHLDLAIEHSPLDAQDRVMARQEDRQGLGLSRGPAQQKSPSSLAARSDPKAARA